jgi:hypothetical protein
LQLQQAENHRFLIAAANEAMVLRAQLISDPSLSHNNAFWCGTSPLNNKNIINGTVPEVSARLPIGGPRVDKQ